MKNEMKVVKLYPYKNTKFHFGKVSLDVDDTIFHSDSLFSALVNLWVKLFGDSQVKEFIDSFPKISSLFYGYKVDDDNELFFLPRPLFFPIPKILAKKDRKLTKKVKFISLGVYELSFNGNWEQVEDVIINNDKDCIYLKKECKNMNLTLFSSDVDEKVSIDRQRGTSKDEHLYTISSIIPDDKTFFYFLYDGESKLFSQLLKNIEVMNTNKCISLALGGELSIGYGSLDSIAIKAVTLPSKDSGFFTNLSVVFPTKDEIEKAKAYTLLERKGWVYLSTLRKKPLYAFAEGSIFQGNVEGNIVNVSPSKNLPAFRYGKAFLIPLKVNDNENL